MVSSICDLWSWRRARLLDFVKVHSETPGFASHEIAKSDREKVLLVKNSDLGVRFALVIRSEESVLEATIQDGDVDSLRRVLEEIVADIADEPKG